MSGLILPGRQQPQELNFGLARQPDGSLAVQVSGAGFVVQWPPMPAEGLKSIAAQLNAAADQEIARRAPLIEANNGSIFQANGPGKIVG